MGQVLNSHLNNKLRIVKYANLEKLSNDNINMACHLALLTCINDPLKKFLVGKITTISEENINK